MKLYHGTTETAARRILETGLLPRAAHGASNWEHTVESNPNAVYLTDTYAAYFAIMSGNSAEDAKVNQLAFVEIETDRLRQQKLVPDEDVIEFCNREKGERPTLEILKQRMMRYRDRLGDFAGQYKTSLQLMGTCAHLGVIPVRAITRVAFIDCIKAARVMVIGIDASITAANFTLCGAQHRAIIRWAFNESMPSLTGLDRVVNADTIARIEAHPHDAVEIMEVNP